MISNSKRQARRNAPSRGASVATVDGSSPARANVVSVFLWYPFLLPKALCLYQYLLAVSALCVILQVFHVLMVNTAAGRWPRFLLSEIRGKSLNLLPIPDFGSDHFIIIVTGFKAKCTSYYDVKRFICVAIELRQIKFKPSTFPST